MCGQSGDPLHNGTRTWGLDEERLEETGGPTGAACRTACPVRPGDGEALPPTTNYPLTQLTFKGGEYYLTAIKTDVPVDWNCICGNPWRPENTVGTCIELLRAAALCRESSLGETLQSSLSHDF